MIPFEKRINDKKTLHDWLLYEKKLYRVKSTFLNNILCALAISETAILFKHQILLRKAEYYKNTNKKIRYLFSIFKLRKMQNKYALQIPLNCCGRGFKIVHLGPILINSNVSFGEDCSVHIYTSFVAGGTTDEAPTIGNNCVIGVGAVVLGGVTIADNVAIGANAVVNKSVLEENIAVAGIPAKKISNNGRLAWKKGKCESN